MIYIILSLLKSKIKKIRFTYKKSTVLYVQLDEFWQIQIQLCTDHNNHDKKISIDRKFLHDSYQLVTPLSSLW